MANAGGQSANQNDKQVSAVGTSGASGAQNEYITVSIRRSQTHLHYLQNLEPEAGEVPDPIERKVVQSSKVQSAFKPAPNRTVKVAAPKATSKKQSKRELREAKMINNQLYQQVMSTANILRSAEQQIIGDEFKELEQPQFARMYPSDKTKQVAAATDGVVSHEDIDYFWDNPSNLPQDKSEIINMIEKSVQNRDDRPIDWIGDG